MNRLRGAAVLRRLPAAVVLLSIACGDGTGPTPPPPPPPPTPVSFGPPIEGGPGLTVYYGAYFDHSGATPRDYQCGIKAYAGHRGVDVLLRSFVVQDSGVGVIAAAPGTVLLTADGAFDRSTAQGSGGFGNHVIVQHQDGTRSIYGHLRNGSLTVLPGQSVETGARLGLVGSSGNSNWPHLHFEVHQGSAVDPFQGPCGDLPSLWRSQLPYQNEFKVADAGLSNRPAVSFGDLLERLPAVDTFRTGDASLLYWLTLANINATATEFRLLDPEQQVAAQLATGPRATFSMTFGTWRVPISGVLTKLGRYTLEFRHHPAGAMQPLLAHSAQFELVAGPIALRQRTGPGLVNGVAVFLSDGRDGQH